jgi:hypothetical protein
VGKLPAKFVEDVQGEFDHATDLEHRLRLLWTLHLVQPKGIDEKLATQLLTDKEPYLRSWAIQLSLEDEMVSPKFLEKLVEAAKSDESPVARLFLASSLQRLTLKDRWDLAGALLTHEEDAQDANLPLMIWYGIEPLVQHDKSRALRLIVQSKFPLIRQHLARRAAALSE